NGAQAPEVSFVATATDLDTAATRFLLDIDGQRIENRDGPERPVTVKWPGQAAGQVAVSFEDRSAARPNRVMTGAWAWFRMLDFAHAQRETDLRSVLRFDLGGHTARVTVDATSVRNPFASRTWQRFSCGEF